MQFKSLFLFWVIILSFPNLYAQNLIKDINTADASSDPKEFVTINNKTYFTANDGMTGYELWVTDGTEAGTKLVKDIVRGADHTYITGMTNLNGTLLFLSFYNSSYSIYKSDGTDAGTIKLADIGSDIFIDGYTDISFVISNNNAYLLQGGNLWKTDGTVAGTVKLGSNFNNSAFTYSYTTLQGVDFNGTLYFVSNHSTGDGLWKTDGTVAGTQLVKKMNLNRTYNLTRINMPLVFNSKIYFLTATVENGSELWVSDGTGQGTQIVKDIYVNPSFDPSDLNGAFELNKTSTSLYFVGRSDYQSFKLWKSDGTAAGTIAVDGTSIGYYPNRANGSQFENNQFRGFEFRNRFYYFYRTTPSNQAVLSDDVSKANTAVTLFANALTDNKIRYSFAQLDTLLYLKYDNSNGGEEVWVNNGSGNTGYRSLKDIWREYGIGSSPRNFHRAGNIVFFSAISKNSGRELWKTDGTEAGTILVKNINLKSENASISQLNKFGNSLLFLAYDDNNGTEIWKTDGTNNGTQRVTNTGVGVRSGLDHTKTVILGELNNKVFFTMTDTVTGKELRYIDNNPNGFSTLKDIYPGITGSEIEQITPYKNKIVFFANNGVNTNGRELWTSDGTEGGTQMLADITPGRSNTRYLSRMIQYDSLIYFMAYSSSNPDVRFWRTDGTTQGTKPVSTSISDTSKINDYTKQFTLIGNKFIFSGYNDNMNYTPWLFAFDGSTTKKLTQLGPDNSGSFPVESNAILNNNLYFTKYVSGSFSSVTIWKTDGTETGTKQVNNTYFQPFLAFVVFKNNIYFIGTDSLTNVPKLWKLNDDGSILALKSLEFANQQYFLEEWNNQLYFQAFDATNGTELWATDGTIQGTKIAADINKGVGSSFPTSLKVFNNVLYFSANDGNVGYELWRMTSTGIAERVKYDAKIALFPNPTQDILNIENQDEEPFNKYNLYDLKGVLIKTNTFSGKNLNINIQDLPASTYFLELVSDKKRAVKKFIKLK